MSRVVAAALALVLAVAVPSLSQPARARAAATSFNYVAPTDRPAYLGIKNISFSQQQDSIRVTMTLWAAPPALDASLSYCPTADGREPFYSIWVPYRDQIRWLFVGRYRPTSSTCSWQTSTFTGALQNADSDMRRGTVTWNVYATDLVAAGQSISPLQWQAQACDVGVGHGACWDYPIGQVTLSAASLYPFQYYVSQFTASQRGEVACGPTSAAMLLRWWKRSTTSPTVDGVIAQLPPLGQGATGWYIWDIAGAIHSMSGLNSFNGVTAQAGWAGLVQSEVQANRPLIALLVTTAGLRGWTTGIRGHYVVVTGIDFNAQTVRYQDPAKGPDHTASFAQFQAAWGATGGDPNPYQYLIARP